MTASGDARPQLHWNVGYWVVAVLLLLWLQSLWQTSRSVEPVPYSQFEQALAQGRITDVKIGDTTITGRLKDPVGPRRSWSCHWPADPIERTY